jgi:hypothetical protein
VRGTWWPNPRSSAAVLLLDAVHVGARRTRWSTIAAQLSRVERAATLCRDSASTSMKTPTRDGTPNESPPDPSRPNLIDGLHPRQLRIQTQTHFYLPQAEGREERSGSSHEHVGEFIRAPRNLAMKRRVRAATAASGARSVRGGSRTQPGSSMRSVAVGRSSATNRPIGTVLETERGRIACPRMLHRPRSGSGTGSSRRRHDQLPPPLSHDPGVEPGVDPVGRVTSRPPTSRPGSGTGS